jgi:hypothetical protein
MRSSYSLRTAPDPTNLQSSSIHRSRTKVCDRTRPVSRRERRRGGRGRATRPTRIYQFRRVKPQRVGSATLAPGVFAPRTPVPKIFDRCRGVIAYQQMNYSPFGQAGEQKLRSPMTETYPPRRCARRTGSRGSRFAVPQRCRPVPVFLQSCPTETPFVVAPRPQDRHAPLPAHARSASEESCPHV